GRGAERPPGPRLYGALCHWKYRAHGVGTSLGSHDDLRSFRSQHPGGEFRCRKSPRSYTSHRASSYDQFPMTPLLSVYHEDREQIGRNNSSHVSLENSSPPVRTTTLFF